MCTCITDLSILLLCSCVFRKVMDFKLTCMYSITKLCGGGQNCGKGVTSLQYCYGSSRIWCRSKLLDISSYVFCWGTFYIVYIDPPIH